VRIELGITCGSKGFSFREWFSTAVGSTAVGSTAVDSTAVTSTSQTLQWASPLVVIVTVTTEWGLHV